jgi:DNA-binding transcriptional ArsR family regulator
MAGQTSTDHATGDVVREFLSVADLLEEPRLARLYAYLFHEGETTVQEVIDALDLSQGTAYADVNRLVETGVLTEASTTQPKTYTAREIALTVTASDGAGEYRITPALVDAVGRRTVDGDIDTYIDRHGIAGLATALDYAVDRERGAVTHRIMARELDISPLAAEIILQALRPVVQEHCDVESSGVSLDAVAAAEDLTVDEDLSDEQP